MNLYDFRKRIQSIYNDAIYGNIKGDIYNELSDLRIDNDFIEEINIESQKMTIIYKLNINTSEKDINNLTLEIRNVIRMFITKNISDIDNDFNNFLNTDMICDFYKLTTQNNIILSVQL